MYTFGDGRHGKLGLGMENFTNQFNPTLCSNFFRFVVKLVACGGCHMLVFACPRLNMSSEMSCKLKDSFIISTNSLPSDDLISTNSLSLNRTCSARLRRRERERSPESPDPMTQVLPLSEDTVSTLMCLSSGENPSSLPPSTLQDKVISDKQDSMPPEELDYIHGEKEPDSCSTADLESLGETTDILNMTHMMSTHADDKLCKLSPIQKQKKEGTDEIQQSSDTENDDSTEYEIQEMTPSMKEGSLFNKLLAAGAFKMSISASVEEFSDEEVDDDHPDQYEVHSDTDAQILDKDSFTAAIESDFTSFARKEGSEKVGEENSDMSSDTKETVSEHESEQIKLLSFKKKGSLSFENINALIGGLLKTDLNTKDKENIDFPSEGQLSKQDVIFGNERQSVEEPECHLKGEAEIQMGLLDVFKQPESIGFSSEENDDEMETDASMWAINNFPEHTLEESELTLCTYMARYHFKFECLSNIPEEQEVSNSSEEAGIDEQKTDTDVKTVENSEEKDEETDILSSDISERAEVSEGGEKSRGEIENVPEGICKGVYSGVEQRQTKKGGEEKDRARKIESLDKIKKKLEEEKDSEHIEKMQNHQEEGNKGVEEEEEDGEEGEWQRENEGEEEKGKGHEHIEEGKGKEGERWEEEVEEEDGEEEGERDEEIEEGEEEREGWEEVEGVEEIEEEWKEGERWREDVEEEGEEEEEGKKEIEEEEEAVEEKRGDKGKGDEEEGKGKEWKEEGEDEDEREWEEDGDGEEEEIEGEEEEEGEEDLEAMEEEGEEEEWEEKEVEEGEEREGEEEEQVGEEGKEEKGRTKGRKGREGEGKEEEEKRKEEADSEEEERRYHETGGKVSEKQERQNEGKESHKVSKIKVSVKYVTVKAYAKKSVTKTRGKGKTIKYRASKCQCSQKFYKVGHQAQDKLSETDKSEEDKEEDIDNLEEDEKSVKDKENLAADETNLEEETKNVSGSPVGSQILHQVQDKLSETDKSEEDKEEDIDNLEEDEKSVKDKENLAADETKLEGGTKTVSGSPVGSQILHQAQDVSENDESEEDKEEDIDSLEEDEKSLKDKENLAADETKLEERTKTVSGSPVGSQILYQDEKTSQEEAAIPECNENQEGNILDDSKSSDTVEQKREFKTLKRIFLFKRMSLTSQKSLLSTSDPPPDLKPTGKQIAIKSSKKNDIQSRTEESDPSSSPTNIEKGSKSCTLL